MRWRKGRRSSNVEDRRGASAGGGIFRGGGSRGGGLRRGGIGGGLGLVVVVVLALVFGVDPMVLLQGLPAGGGPGGGGSLGGSMSGGSAVESRQVPPGQEELADFVSVILADTEDTWNTVLARYDMDYQEPNLVLFTDAVQSACGFANAAMGPFYCPGDRKVYLDLGFFNELKQRFQAPGDFAQAYVIAHEVGHHLQNLLGIEAKLRQAQQQVGKREANALSVMMELQADCLAGVWAQHANSSRQLLEEGDIEEGLNAASAIGDDRLQRQSGGRVVPDSFTHGSSEQRVRWFKRGFTEGQIESCDTFSASSL